MYVLPFDNITFRLYRPVLAPVVVLVMMSADGDQLKEQISPTGDRLYSKLYMQILLGIL
jgi:hypothetical protein